MKWFSTFTIFNGEMRFIYIGPLMIMIERDWHTSMSFDREIWNGMKYEWMKFWKRS